MDRERLVPVVLALLAVVALGAAAATLDTTVGSDSVGSGDADGPGDSDEFSMGSTNSTVEPGTSPIPPWVLQALFAAIAVVAVLTLAYFLYREGFDAIRHLLVGVVLFAIALGFVYLLASIIDQGSIPPGLGQASSGEFSIPGGASQADRVPEVVSEPPVAALLFAIVVIVGLAVVVYRSTDDDEVEPPTPTESAPTQNGRLEAVGGAAGRAADEIEDDGAVSNAVYQAWRDMTGHLDVPNPNASTPGEFADAAVAAGMEPGDVDELTSLFELTRYGGREVTADRATRAVEALRRIERAYAAESDTVTTDGRGATTWTGGDDAGRAADASGTDAERPDASGTDASGTDAERPDRSGGPDGGDA